MKNGIPSERIMIGGFGGGGALSLYTAFHTRHKLAGVIALSSWIPLYKEIGDTTKVNKEIPYLQAHGDSDSIVPHELGQLVSYLLRGFLPNYEFKSYKGLGHKTSEEEIWDVKQFIVKCLPYFRTIQPNHAPIATVEELFGVDPNMSDGGVEYCLNGTEAEANNQPQDCQVFQGQNAEGMDITEEIVESNDACSELCSLHPDCMGWARHQDEGNCFLMAKIITIFKDPIVDKSWVWGRRCGL